MSDFDQALQKLIEVAEREEILFADEVVGKYQVSLALILEDECPAS